MIAKKKARNKKTGGYKQTKRAKLEGGKSPGRKTASALFLIARLAGEPAHIY
jgi:hypothetical protein